MWVVKLGGSLHSSDYLKRWLEEISQHGRGQVVLVVGGGPFADVVRDSQKQHHYDDRTAHNMAMLGMQQYAEMIANISPTLTLTYDIASIHKVLDEDGIPVWMPYNMLINETAIQPDWNMTSDGLATWLAEQMNIQQLLFIKSVPLPEGPFSYQKLSQAGLIDEYSANYLEKNKIDLHWLSREKSAQFSNVLQGKSGQLKF